MPCALSMRKDDFQISFQIRIINKVDMSDPLLGYPLYRATDELGDVGHGDKELRLDDGELPGDLGQQPPPPGELLHQAARLTQAQSGPHRPLLPFPRPRHAGHVTNRLKKIKCMCFTHTMSVYILPCAKAGQISRIIRLWA